MVDGVLGTEQSAHPTSALVDAALQIEQNESLDAAAGRLHSLAQSLVADPARKAMLQGHALGHALHPMLTDVPIGVWTSASVLDLVGGGAARPAARRLVALGIVAAVPTALTGAAEYADTSGVDRRTGLVHATSNSLALLCYTASWLARRRGRHVRGAALALVGGLALGVGGFLGGHLSVARKVGSRVPELSGEADAATDGAPSSASFTGSGSLS